MTAPPYRAPTRPPPRPWRYVLRALRWYARRVWRTARWFVVIASAAMALATLADWLLASREFRCPSHGSDTRGRIEMLRTAVRLYQNDRPNACPTVEQLITSGILEANRPTRDAWGRPFRVDCSGEEVVVHSDGPDRKAGTDDDL